jgi:hypothetical protein
VAVPRPWTETGGATNRCWIKGRPPAVKHRCLDPIAPLYEDRLPKSSGGLGPSASGNVRRGHLKSLNVPEAALGAVRDTLREHGEPLTAGTMTFMQARTANEELKAQERRVGCSV